MRFPLQLSLVRLLCVMSASGVERGQHFQQVSDDAIESANYVYHYLLSLTTFALYVPGNSELSTIIQRRSDKAYTTLRAVTLAGAGTIPPNSLANLLGEGSDGSRVVLFEHRWSGWRFLGEILRGYVRLKTSAGRVGVGRERKPNIPHRRTTIWECSVEDLLSGGGQGITEDDVADILDLIRYVGNSRSLVGRLVELVQALEHDESDGAVKGADIVELATLILEDSLRKSTQAARRLVGSCLSVLATLLTPGSVMASRVWLYLRSSSIFTPTSTRSRTLTSGTYPTTLAILRLISGLVSEQLGSLGTTSTQEEELKSEVLVKALSYIHHGLWNEHRRWRYDHISEKYEVGTLMISTYTNILRYGGQKRQSLVLRFFQASKTDLEWAVETLATGKSDIEALYAARRFADARTFLRHLDALVEFFRSMLHASPGSGLESVLCDTFLVTKPGSGAQLSVEPISTLAAYSEDYEVEAPIALGSLKLLAALAATDQRLYGHLLKPDKTVRNWVRLAGNPFNDMSLRVAVWEFATKCALHQPALRDVFVFGKVSVPSTSTSNSMEKLKKTLMSTALDILQTSEELWTSNPQLLHSVVTFIDAVNQSAVAQSLFDESFWSRMSHLCCVDLGPAPEPEATAAIISYCYRAATKAKALHILAAELKRAGYQSDAVKQPFEKTVDSLFSDQDALSDHIQEAISNSFDPKEHTATMSKLEQTFPAISLNAVALQSRPQEREFGEHYLYQLGVLRSQLASLQNLDDKVLINQGIQMISAIASLNLNWSLADSQMVLLKAWKTTLVVGASYIKKKLKKIIPGLNGIAVTVIATIGAESRDGPVMTVVHSERLQIELALFELVWFDGVDDKKDPKPLEQMMNSLSRVINSDAFPPESSIRGLFKPEYHSFIFQALFYLLQRSQKLLRNLELSTDIRLSIIRNVQTALVLVMASLQYSFNGVGTVSSAISASELTLLTSLFAQCTSANIGLPSSIWSQGAREIGLVGSSLRVLRESGDPALASIILFFHSTMAPLPESAIQLVDEGAIATYSALSPNATSDLWCMMISVLTTLLSTLGYSTNLVELEVSSLIQVHGDRIAKSLKWTIAEAITRPTLEETGRIAELFYVFAKASKPFFSENGLSAGILRAFSLPALDLLQQFTYLFTHPNHLASLIEPESEEELKLISNELPKSSSFSIGDLFNVKARPITARYLISLTEASNALIMALMVISGSGKVLSAQESDWGADVYPLVSSVSFVVVEVLRMF
jgi:nuclear pore complex protein Nup188